MSYLVLARKYRPMFFADVVGQEHVTMTLQNAIEQKRVANAYLFSGPRGVGKTTVARLLAKALNCDQGPTTQPCNTCSCCVEINESRSFDVFEIDGASNRGIDEVRNLREGLRYSPNPGKYRIYIIDEVHMLTNEAFNALLKTLEEPPSRVLFIFATTEAHKVPATILSRCQKFDFKRLSNKMIMDQLRSICAKEAIEIDEDSLRIIAGKAEGGMRDAQSILDQIIAFAGKNVRSADTERLLGMIDRNLFFRVSDLITNSDVAGSIQLADELFVGGVDFSDFLLGLAEHLRNLLVIKITAGNHELDVSEVDAEHYRSQAPLFSSEDLLRYIKIASETENLIKRSLNPRLHVEVALVKMVKMGKSVELSELLQTVAELKKKPDSILIQQNAADKRSLFDNHRVNQFFGGSAPSEIETLAAAEPEAIDTTVSLADIESKWPDFVDDVKKKRIALGIYLSMAWPKETTGGKMQLAFPPDCSFQMSNVEKDSVWLQDLLRETSGCNLRFCCMIDNSDYLAQKRKWMPIVDKRREFEDLLKNNAMVQHILDLFDAEFAE
ncbi:MAG TPA: DNA polymerase III subunit gamma/tau [bacterium]|nr:DNA polymerase III subunit gamma/tau [bacterium]HPG45234.1 DNA polymerase III subunit gamma/tau [bacterium]HPM97476.1 DNA polymerase III subunit gamma/tau [bacterium]